MQNRHHPASVLSLETSPLVDITLMCCWGEKVFQNGLCFVKDGNLLTGMWRIHECVLHKICMSILSDSTCHEVTHPKMELYPCVLLCCDIQGIVLARNVKFMVIPLNVSSNHPWCDALVKGSEIQFDKMSSGSVTPCGIFNGQSGIGTYLQHIAVNADTLQTHLLREGICWNWQDIIPRLQKNKTSLCVLRFVTLERNLASMAVLMISKEVLGLNFSQDTPQWDF